MKKFVSLILTLVMVLSMFAVVPMSASAQINLDDSKVYIKSDGKYYEVEKGQTYTYNYYLTVPEVKVSSLDAWVSYDSAGLEFKPTVDEYGDDALEVMFPILKNVVWNYTKESAIYFNYSNIAGVRLHKADSVIFTGEFLVTADSGVYEINTTVKTIGDSNMNKITHNGEVYGEYYESQALPNLTPVEEMVNPTEIQTDAPTQVETLEPTEIQTDAPTQVETLEPTEIQTDAPTQVETLEPTEIQTDAPTQVETQEPTEIQTDAPTQVETQEPTEIQTDAPTQVETFEPTEIQTDAPTQVETLEPTESETAQPTLEPTEIATEEEEFVTVKVDGLEYKLQEGDIFTYVYNLTCQEKICAIDVHTSYDSTGLEFIPAVDEYGDVDLSAMFPVIKDVVYNFNLRDRIVFNYSSVSGVRFPALDNGQFTENNRVFVCNFKVTASSGYYEINTKIKTLGGAETNRIIFDYKVVDESAGAFAVAKIVDVIPEFPTEIKPTMNPEVPHKVYLVNSGNWFTPLTFVWNYNDGEQDMMWPGVEMQATGIKASNGAWIYEYTFSKVYDGIIFNNGGFAQTEDLEFMEDMYYDVVTQQWYSSPDVIPAVSDDVYIVAGLDTLCGSNWDPSDVNNIMTYNEEKGIYEIVYENVAAGHYEFKVTTNYAWDNGDYNLEGDASFGGPNAVAKVEQDGSTVIIGFDGEKALLTIMAPLDHPTVPTEPTEVEPTEVEPTEVEPTEETQEPTQFEGEATIYLINSEGWKEPYVYVWRETDTYDEVTRWPGVKMELIGEMNGYELYAYTADKAYENIIFNGDNYQSQTEDLKFIVGGIYDNGKEEWINLPLDPTEPLDPQPTQPEPSQPEPSQPKPTEEPKPGSPGGGDESEPDDILYGDVDGNGKVNIFDASYVQKSIAGYDGYELDERAFEAADVDFNGKINVFDASRIQKFIAGYFDSFK